MRIPKFAIIGNGSWATALAKMLTDNGQELTWWMRTGEAVTHLSTRFHNQNYLPSVRFQPGILHPTDDLQKAIEQSDHIIIAVPSAYVVALLNNLPENAFEGKQIISAIKGILPQQHSLLNDYLSEQFHFPVEKYMAITGPCHAEEVAQERLSYLTFSGLNTSETQQAARYFVTDYIRTTVTHDVWGAQYAAVLKNIYAIGAGMAHGLGYGDNFLSVYITNCYREMFGFLENQFEKIHPSTEMPDFHTSAYLGDLLVTCYSPHSRNRTFGALLGKGYSVKSATTEMSMVAEGYYAAQGMMHIAQKVNPDMPIMYLIYEMLWKEKGIGAGLREIEQLLS
jgi:glycerol-3-phosphate dehydrogenase (NAD(P)+)